MSRKLDGLAYILSPMLPESQSDHIGDGLFLPLIAAHDELKFDTHYGTSRFEWQMNDASHYTGGYLLAPASPCSRALPVRRAVVNA